ncbi:hypothetical protein GCM10022251_31330 [Phytohabitans flavus]|uniref:Uncharacterized protein n=1 Tax=Phytohabitans flavus TaxID=1076124 RepID=A0A6F8XWP0_9ACTN|nr:hypothetical protein [Phytohabitans flavus]BCB78272.1 hypothetical protein Pflav_046820 [Phytohabitans flavus]
MSDERRGVILYGATVIAVAEALRELDPRYVPLDRVAPAPGQVPVLCCLHGAEADAAREAAPGIAWLVVELYRPGADVEHAHHPALVLNTSKFDPETAARVIDQPDLVTWYEIINPIRAITVDGRPPANDYSNIAFIEPDGHRIVAHAVRVEGPAPECLPTDTKAVLQSHDAWALARPPKIDVCQACALRHR